MEEINIRSPLSRKGNKEETHELANKRHTHFQSQWTDEQAKLPRWKKIREVAPNEPDILVSPTTVAALPVAFALTLPFAVGVTLLWRRWWWWRLLHSVVRLSALRRVSWILLLSVLLLLWIHHG